MNRLLFPVAGLLLAGLFVLISGGAGFVDREQHEPEPQVPDAMIVRRLAPLPALHDATVIDAAVAVIDAGLTRESVLEIGLLNRSEGWIDTVFGVPEWQPVAGEPYTYTGFDQTRLRLVVERGVVVEIQAKFPPDALSASATGMSPWIVGNRAAIGVHLESDRADPKVLKGRYETEDGRTFYYRAQMRTTGEPPYGPDSLRTRSTPFRD